MQSRTSIRKTFAEPTVKIAAFQEARQWMDNFLNGRIDPQQVMRLIDKGKALMNQRKNTRKSRPSRLLNMKADGTVVKRPSGLLVPPKYKDTPGAVENLLR